MTEPSPAAASHRADPAPRADAATRCRRWARLAGCAAGAGVASLRAPVVGARGRRRLVVRTAARVLTAAGVRVEVHAPPSGWPPAARGLVLVDDPRCWVAGLALRTVAPGAAVLRPPAAAAGSPVAVRYRGAGGAAPSLPGEPRWRSVARVVAADGLVVEVHLLPAREPDGLVHVAYVPA